MVDHYRKPSDNVVASGNVPQGLVCFACERTTHHGLTAANVNGQRVFACDAHMPDDAPLARRRR
ncbi:hypothetical protein [Mesorhizobium sp.]|uniref:hypothetical protein n=1 Tax=Mesorhizobium sp. TaxID=1871066 RepID=UPI000FE6701A|nr:hypothetical protein [Mesorhizobium sp.]RWO89551.1 MAG: hypothetical protein EOQ96_05165 [Mesorhizobium sp.]